MKKLWVIILSIFLILLIIDQAFLKDSILNFGEETYEKVEDTKNLKTGLEPGQLAYDFELKTMDGQTMKLSDLRGKKVLLNFWASWCGPCEVEMPHMQKVYEELNGEDIEIIAVNLTHSERNEKVIKDFIKKHQLTFPIPLDENGEVSYLYEAITIPTSYFVDSDGVVRLKKVGPMDEEFLREQFEKLP